MGKRDKEIPYEVVIQERKRVDLYGKTQIRGKTSPGYIYGQRSRPEQLHSLYYCEAEFLSRLVTAKHKRYEQFCNRYSR